MFPKAWFILMVLLLQSTVTFANPDSAVFRGGRCTDHGKDSGVTWVGRDSARYWNSITCSSDGSKLVAVEYGGRIYTSSDSGITWYAHESPRTWTSITSSSDGSRLAAVASGAQIYTSSDSGLHWTGQESARNWSAVASSSDGSKLAAVDSFGQIHTALGSPATPILTGGSGSSVDLV
jgi:hypothetical protein